MEISPSESAAGGTCAGGPDPEQIVAALERLKAYRRVAAAPRLQDLVSFLVTETIGGRADQLKGYTVGIEVFGKDKSFDPGTDPIVRVQMCRLRNVLKEYYLTEGRRDPVRIVLEKGGYVPRFVRWTEPSAEGGVNGPLSDLLPPAEGAVLPGRASSAGSPFDEAGSAGRPEARIGLPRPMVLVEALATSGVAPLTQQLVSDLERTLARSDWIGVLHSSGGGSRTRIPDHQPRHRLLVEADARISVRLVCESEGLLLWSEHFEPGQSAGSSLSIELAHRVARRIGQRHGPLVARHLGRTRRNAAVAAWARAERCLDSGEVGECRATRQDLEVLASGHGDVLAQVLLCEVLLLESRFVGDAGQGMALRQKAVAAARRASIMAPESAQARKAMMAALLAAGDVAAAGRVGRQAVSLNGDDADVLAAHAGLLVATAHYSEGLALIRQAVSWCPSHPPWWDYVHFLADFAAGGEGVVSAAGLLQSHLSEHLAAAAVMSATAGNVAALAEARRRLAEVMPGSPSDAGRVFRHATGCREVSDRLTEAVSRILAGQQPRAPAPALGT